MKDYTSRLKSFDLESMSGCTPQATGIRASVENVVSDYDFGDLWRLVGANPEPVEIVNTRLRARTSKKHLHLAAHWLA